MDRLYFMNDVISSNHISSKRIENKRDFIECIQWSHDNYKKNPNTNEEKALFECTERNNIFREQYLNYYVENEHITEDKKIDNKFYRNAKFRYDAVIPINIFEIIMKDFCLFIDDPKQQEKAKFILKNIDRIFMLCSIIFYRSSRYKNRNVHKRDMTQISHQVMKHTLGTNFNKIMEYLCNDVKIIEWDKTYIPGFYDKTGNNSGLCRSMKFTEKVDSKEVVQYRMQDKALIKRIYTDPEMEIRHMNNESKVVRDNDINAYFSKNFTLSEKAYQNREIDLEGFTRYIAKLENKEDEKFKRFKIGRDVFGNRLYNPFLYLKKELRQFIIIDGSDRTTNIDINNSHPYIFSMMFHKPFLDKVRHLVSDTEYEIFKSFGENTKYQEQIDVFQKITSSGSYYGYLQENMNIDMNLISIKDVKKMNMCYFYGKMNKNNKIYKYFNNNFNFINIVKYTIIKHASYKRLCQLLQQVESFILIDGIFEPLREFVKFIPLHDGFLCKKEDESFINKALNDKFTELKVKYSPTWNKASSLDALNESIRMIKLKHCNMFISKNMLMQGLNNIIQSVGIRNRVFREGLKPESLQYIDMRFEDMRDVIPDEIANTYYDLRINLESKDYICFDFSAHFDEYMRCCKTKRKYYGKNIFDYIKLNPVEFLNEMCEIEDKAKIRVKEQNYLCN